MSHDDYRLESHMLRPLADPDIEFESEQEEYDRLEAEAAARREAELEHERDRLQSEAEERAAALHDVIEDIGWLPALARRQIG